MGIALVVGFAGLPWLSAAGYLTAFGVRLPVVPEFTLLAVIVVAGVAVTFVSAALAAAVLESVFSEHRWIPLRCACSGDTFAG